MSRKLFSQNCAKMQNSQHEKNSQSKMFSVETNKMRKNKMEKIKFERTHKNKLVLDVCKGEAEGRQMTNHITFHFWPNDRFNIDVHKSGERVGTLHLTASWNFVPAGHELSFNELSVISIYLKYLEFKSANVHTGNYLTYEDHHYYLNVYHGHKLVGTIQAPIAPDLDNEWFFSPELNSVNAIFGTLLLELYEKIIELKREGRKL